MDDDLGERLGKNVRHLRESRGFTQGQIAKLAGLPRATWANLESGDANPTVSVLHKIAVGLQVTIEELLAEPRAACAFYPKASLKIRNQGQATVRKLLPDPIPGMEMDRIEIPPGGKMPGVPHTPGTREYLACEAGEIVLVALGESWHLHAGDLVAFRGDQRHSYANPGTKTAVGYSVVVLARMV
ncbi:MAG: XRE family transcriptional regulator [Polyangiaceae bacterium]